MIVYYPKHEWKRKRGYKVLCNKHSESANNRVLTELELLRYRQSAWPLERILNRFFITSECEVDRYAGLEGWIPWSIDAKDLVPAHPSSSLHTASLLESWVHALTGQGQVSIGQYFLQIKLKLTCSTQNNIYIPEYRFT